MRPVTCPFTKAGCKVQLVHRDLEDHLSSYTSQHLDMVTKSFDMLKTRADSAERQMHIAKAEVEDLKKTVEITKHQQERRLAAIARNVAELLSTCSETQMIAIQSIQSLTSDRYTIQRINSPLTFQMINYSEYKRSGKIWYSPPFYVAGGYKMCIAAYANGAGPAQGAYLSISICLLNGEFDDDLPWPVELPFHLMVEIIKQGDEFEGGSPVPDQPSNPKTYVYFHSDTPQDRVLSGVLTEARKCENFAQHDLVENWFLYYDAVTFRIMAESEFL